MDITDKIWYLSIGEVSSRLGVTPSFLKYYEQQGILSPIVMPNGYRFYEGRHLSTIQECIKYHNLGYTAKEIRNFLHSPYSDAQPMFTQKMDEIDRQITYLEYSKVFLKRSITEYPKYDTDQCWSIDMHGDFYFLPQFSMMTHSPGKAFLKLVTQWNQWLPAVRIASVVDRRDETDVPPLWGMAMPGEFARAMKLSYSDPIQYIPGCRSLVVYDRRPIDNGMNAKGTEYIRENMLSKTDEIAAKHHLTITGPSYFFVRAKVFEEDSRYTYQKVITPIL